MADLREAAQTQLRYAANEAKSGDFQKALSHTARAQGYLQRLAGEDGPSEVAAAADEPLSPDPSTALHQILAQTGHPVQVIDGASQAIDPLDVIKDATPEQLEALTLLGFFGQQGSRSDIDYSIRAKYYDQDAQGNETPKAGYEDGSWWADYLAGK